MPQLKINEIHQTPSVDGEILVLARRAMEIASQMQVGQSGYQLAGYIGSLKAVTGMLLRLLECPEKTMNDVVMESFDDERFEIQEDLFHPFSDDPSSDADRAGMSERGEL